MTPERFLAIFAIWGATTVLFLLAGILQAVISQAFYGRFLYPHQTVAVISMIEVGLGIVGAAVFVLVWGVRALIDGAS
jgi:hypothetical protein